MRAAAAPSNPAIFLSMISSWRVAHHFPVNQPPAITFRSEKVPTTEEAPCVGDKSIVSKFVHASALAKVVLKKGGPEATLLMIKNQTIFNLRRVLS